MDRRKTNDFWTKLLFFLNIFASVLLIFILFVFHRAQPEFESVFDRVYELELRTKWDIQYLYYLIYCVLAGITISITGLLLGFFRGRRSNDHKKMLIITGVISLIMLVISIFVL
ncbi:hypothetical protein KAJ27_05390 [bacterium]|nr:hypothetical protein [bacterium]